MGHSKNKRYVVYRTMSRFTYYSRYFVHSNSETLWTRNIYSRDQLVLLAATLMDHKDYPFFDNLLDEVDPTIPLYKKIPVESRPGVKDYNFVETDYYVVKVIKEGQELPVDTKALYHEALIRKELLDKNRNKRYNWYWRPSKKSWKKNHKCRKQYMIHQNNHSDKLSYNKYSLSHIDDGYR